MNIAIFTNNYLPNPYGVSGSVESFRREFEKKGHTVYVFAPRWPGYTDRNRRVFRYPSIDTNIKFHFPVPVSYSPRIKKILADLKIDIIHSQHPNLLGSEAFFWAKKKNVPLVFTWHTLYDHYVHFAKFIPKKWAANYIIKKAVRYADRADAVVVPTDSIIPILRKWGVKNKNIFPVATGVDPDEFENPDRKNFREKSGVSENEIVLLLVSRLTAEKNIPFVFRSVFPLLGKNSGLKFLVFGGGDLVSELRKMTEERGLERQVVVSGETERENLKNIFASGDIFVYGSKSETQGMVVSEAMYSGLPVVAVRATGISSLVREGENGFLVSEKEEDFKKALERLITDKNLRQKFGEASVRIAKAEFTSEVCAEKMLAVYRKAMKEKGKSSL